MHFGFSLFRIATGVTMLIGGYDKVIKLLISKFDPEQFGLLKFFLGSFHGAEAKVAPHVLIFFPKFSLYILTYLTPFWELFIGASLVFGLWRKVGTYAGIALMAIFLLGSKASSAGTLTLLDQYLHLFAYFAVYVGLIFKLEDPLALDRFCNKCKNQSK